MLSVTLRFNTDPEATCIHGYKITLPHFGMQGVNYDMV
jgi:hypothetical protein